MHSHGVPNFPDPNSSGQIPKDQIIALDPSSPQFAGGPASLRTPLAISAAQARARRRIHAHTAAMLAFARCIRSHGFPNFPDPTSSGQLTHQMVAGAGINLHQPAVLQAGDACVSVTHGVITKADRGPLRRRTMTGNRDACTGRSVRNERRNDDDIRQ